MARVRTFVWDYPKEKGLPYTDEDAIAFLTKWELLPAECLCSSGHQMDLITGVETRWICPKRVCRKRRTVFVGDLGLSADSSPLSFLRFVHLWSSGEAMAACSGARRLNASVHAASEWRNFLRRICLADLELWVVDAVPMKVGGEGRLVEVDNTVVKKLLVPKEANINACCSTTSGTAAAKNNHLDEHGWKEWVVGGLCRETGATFTQRMAVRNAATLIAAIAANVADGSHVLLYPGHGFSDEELNAAAAAEMVSEHRVRFVTEEEAQRTEAKEVKAEESSEEVQTQRLWGSTCWRKRHFRGTQLHDLESYIVEFIWRTNVKRPMDAILKAIKTHSVIHKASRLSIDSSDDPVTKDFEGKSDLKKPALGSEGVPSGVSPSVEEKRFDEGGSSPTRLQGQPPLQKAPAVKTSTKKIVRPSGRRRTLSSPPSSSDFEIDDDRRRKAAEVAEQVDSDEEQLASTFDESIGQVGPFIQPSKKGETYYYCTVCEMDAPLQKNGLKTVRAHLYTQRHNRLARRAEKRKLAEVGNDEKSGKRNRCTSSSSSSSSWSLLERNSDDDDYLPRRRRSKRKKKRDRSTSDVVNGKKGAQEESEGERRSTSTRFCAKLDSSEVVEEHLGSCQATAITGNFGRRTEEVLGSSFTVKQEKVGDDDPEDSASCSDAEGRLVADWRTSVPWLSVLLDSMDDDGLLDLDDSEVVSLEHLKTMTIDRLQCYTRISDSKFYEWLRLLRLVPDIPVCTCGDQMVQQATTAFGRRFFVCATKSCENRVQGFMGSMFEGTNLSLKEAMVLSLYWALDELTHTEMATVIERLNGTRPPCALIIHWYRLFRKVCTHSVECTDWRIGGAGKVVLVEECFIRRRKTTASEKLFVIGGVDCNNDGESSGPSAPAASVGCFIGGWIRRDAQNLSRIVRQFVRPGSTVICGLWAVYGRAELSNDDYRLVMPSELSDAAIGAELVGSGKKALDELWRKFKRANEKNVGLESLSFESSTDEFLWRLRYGGNECFYNLWKQISEIFAI